MSDLYKHRRKPYACDIVRRLAAILSVLLTVLWTLPSVAMACGDCPMQKKAAADCQDKKHDEEEKSETPAKAALPDCHRVAAKTQTHCEDHKDKKNEDQVPSQLFSRCCCIASLPVRSDTTLTKAVSFEIRYEHAKPVLVISTLPLTVGLTPRSLFAQSPPGLKPPASDILVRKQSFLI